MYARKGTHAKPNDGALLCSFPLVFWRLFPPQQVLKTVKRLETQGYSYEGADASVNLLVRRTMRGYVPPFKCVLRSLLAAVAGRWSWLQRPAYFLLRAPSTVFQTM